jgi:hypothetical protein
MPDAVVARKLGMTPAEVRTHRAQAERERTRTGESFDTVQHGDVEPSPLDRIDTIHEEGSKIQSMRQALANMNPRDKEIFLKYRDPDNPRTQTQLAQEYGVSQTLINRIIQRSNKLIQDIHEQRGFQGNAPRKPISGGSDAPEQVWGDKPTRTRPLTSRELGTNPRARNNDPTADISGTSDRFQGNNPRFQRELQRRREISGGSDVPQWEDSGPLTPRRVDFQTDYGTLRGNQQRLDEIRNKFAGFDLLHQQIKRQLE